MTVNLYDCVTAKLLVRRGPRYGGRFDSCEDVVGVLLLPEGEPVGGYVFSDEDCKIFFSGEEESVYTTVERRLKNVHIIISCKRNIDRQNQISTTYYIIMITFYQILRVVY